MRDLGVRDALEDKVKQDYKGDLEYFKKSADLGNPLANGDIGVMYYCGCGVESDYDKAFSGLRRQRREIMLRR